MSLPQNLCLEHFMPIKKGRVLDAAVDRRNVVDRYNVGQDRVGVLTRGFCVDWQYEAAGSRGNSPSSSEHS